MSQVMQGEILPFNRPPKKAWQSIAAPVNFPGSQKADEMPDSREANALYTALLQRDVSSESVASAGRYLNRKLQLAEQLDSDFPGSLSELEAWSQGQNEKVSLEYQAYLDSRKTGAPRRYFSSKAHALNFIRRVAPTKLVDGAWLYGMTKYWNDFNYSSLIRIYLEELGNGNPATNHVLIYKRLLAEYGCEDFAGLSDDHFTQGAIQLSLAYSPDDFLPEVIGFNFGYEQLPLHLLITAYELNELGIDPSYFTLHTTIDNRATGHAHKAVEAVLQNIPIVGNEEEYFRRVKNGYQLNMLGACTTSIIDSFDLYQEMLNVFREKSRYGKTMHSDYCRLEGRTVNEWLADDEQLPGFIRALENKGWIRRHQDPAESRFWKLIDGDHAEMFGVFSIYEKQVIYEWIAGDWKPEQVKIPELGIAALAGRNYLCANNLSFRTRQRLLNQIMPNAADDLTAPAIQEEMSSEVTAQQALLEQKISSARDKQEIFAILTRFISPSMHHTAVGLMATRIYSSLL